MHGDGGSVRAMVANKILGMKNRKIGFDAGPAMARCKCMGAASPV